MALHINETSGKKVFWESNRCSYPWKPFQIPRSRDKYHGGFSDHGDGQGALQVSAVVPEVEGDTVVAVVNSATALRNVSK